MNQPQLGPWELASRQGKLPHTADMHRGNAVEGHQAFESHHCMLRPNTQLVPVGPGMFCPGMEGAVNMPGWWGPQGAKAWHGQKLGSNLSSATSCGMWNHQPSLNLCFIICYKRMMVFRGVALALNRVESLCVVLDSCFSYVLHSFS